MSSRKNLEYVSEVTADSVIVVRGRRREKVPFADEAELAAVLTSLRDAGLPLFRVDHGWPPGAVFDSLRERGVVVGQYVSVSWAGPNDPIITRDQ